ncbi:MAG TPA: ATP-binding cassette domain-containing protein, partial [Candidatus Hydrogenedentes bacterium]|nr:ATP-binding cassette domain-containing protein [Candidatus Hydrogenedentota bacterium]
MCSDAANNSPTIIEVRNLVTHYGDTLILEDISFDVPEGEIFVIIGGSGCGKTTLLKHMAGLLQPTSGQIRYSGTDITTMDEDEVSDIQRDIGIAFQSGALFNSLTVGENVALPMREYTDMKDDLIEAMVLLKLSLVGLSAAKDLLPAQLSGGMKKRAGLARAIALDPPIVYFDEPSAGLDPIMASGLDDLILKLKSLLGITFIIVTVTMINVMPRRLF